MKDGTYTLEPHLDVLPDAHAAADKLERRRLRDQLRSLSQAAPGSRIWRRDVKPRPGLTDGAALNVTSSAFQRFSRVGHTYRGR